ncbi:MAG TPA: glycosyltransferase 61 family protein [Galbitalea sp.]|jgi:capsular polysaccharide biosynthesis protein|nr:glycosyltransferase 61 family protein [Galbitalea sp.]
MTTFTAPARNYVEFARAFVSLTEAFWRDHDEASRAASVDLLRVLDSVTAGQHIASASQVVTLTGWLLPRDGYRLRRGELRLLNPEYDVQVHRFALRELGRRGQLFRAGFRVVATGSRDLPQFTFRISSRGQEPLLLPPSNSNGAFQAAHFPRFTLDAGVLPSQAARGYLDSVVQAPLGEPDNPATWLAALAHDHPAELFETIDAPAGQFLAPAVARLAAIFPSQSRWSDRFAIAALGAQAVFASDLLPATVVRPTVPGGVPSVGTLPAPGFVRTGEVTRYSPTSETLPMPDPTWRVFHDAQVQDGGTVLIGSSLVVYENSADPRHDFVSGQQYTIFGSQSHADRALVRLKPCASESIMEGILLSGRNDSNWFHWLIEYLPRVMQVDAHIDASVPFLVTARTPQSGMDALRSLSSRRIVAVDPDVLQSVKRLHVAAPPVQVLDTTRVPWKDGLSVNPLPLRAMRAAWGLRDDDIASGAPIFLSRKSRHRGLTNEDRLAAIARRHGLNIRDPGAMSFDDQLALFTSAPLIVGGSGAVMANYLMMSPGSRVLALTSDALIDFILPAAIAEIAAVEFAYVSGPTQRPLSAFRTRNDWLQSDFVVRPDVFEHALIEALRGPSGPQAIKTAPTTIR